MVKQITRAEIESEGIIKFELVHWYKKKWSAHMGAIYLTPSRIVFMRSPSLIGGLIGNLFNKSAPVHDMPFNEIASCTRTNLGKALQVQLQLKNGSTFTFGTHKNERENWIVALATCGVISS